MQVTVTFNIDNEDFDRDHQGAVRSVLDQVEDFVINSTEHGHNLRDRNGNRIGQVTLTGYDC